MSDNQKPITPEQLRRLQADYNRAKLENDPRSYGTTGTVYPDTREGRLAWAQDHLGVKVTSFSNLSILQAGYLLDVLAGKPTKLDTRLVRLIGDAKIKDLDAWFAAIQAKRNYWYFRGKKVHELNRYQKWKLCELLTERVGEPPPIHYKTIQPSLNFPSPVVPASEKAGVE